MMRERCGVYQRTAGTDTWVRVATLSGSIEELTAFGARRESKLLEPDVTHSGRFPRNGYLKAGVRVRRLSDNAEWVVKVARDNTRPAPGHAHLLLAEAEAVIT